MFVRYLGGGIGHLEQFPTADHNNNEHTPTHNSGDTEAEVDDFSMADTAGVDDGHEEDEDEENEDEEREEVEEDSDEENDSEMEELLDEETGNVY